MTRLTEREIHEIRRVQRAQPAEVREDQSELRLAEATEVRRPETANDLPSLLARYSGLADLVWLLRHKVAGPIARILKDRRAARQLHRLSDHVLRDIGLERGQIEIVVAKQSKASAPESSPPDGLIRALGQWSWRRNVAAQLNRLDDRMLSDIGISRGDIPALVKRMEMTHTASTGKLAKLSRQAADDIARLDPVAVARLGFVKTALDTIRDGSAAHRVAAR